MIGRWIFFPWSGVCAACSAGAWPKLSPTPPRGKLSVYRFSVWLYRYSSMAHEQNCSIPRLCTPCFRLEARHTVSNLY